MRTTTISLNPFSLMMEPEIVLQTMERSQSLRKLRCHSLRPLDRPLIPFKTAAVDAHLRVDADFDDANTGLND